MGGQGMAYQKKILKFKSLWKLEDLDTRNRFSLIGKLNSFQEFLPAITLHR